MNLKRIRVLTLRFDLRLDKMPVSLIPTEIGFALKPQID